MATEAGSHPSCQRKLQEALSVEMRNAVAEVLQSQGKTNDTLLKIVLPEMYTRFYQMQGSLAQKAFLDSLFFPDMFARHRNIAPPSEGTYEWIFDQSTEQNNEKRTKLGQFKNWLSTDEPYFWINGKAGPGKSSLMSFIESDKRTEQGLKIWSGSRKLYIFSLFFWRPGSDLQKSSIALATVLLNKPFATLQQYADECRLMKHRIISKSKGLIELEDDDWRHHKPEDSRWALVDMSTEKSRTDFIHESELTDLARYDTILLRWVHRSAYDCIMNSPNHDLATSLKPENETDLARNTLAVVVWLSTHHPQIVVTPESQLKVTISGIAGIEVFLSIPSVDMSVEIDQAFDELYDTLISSLYRDDGRTLC
ncbi:hypothetical protein MBLNU13_g08126t1 [Cladosporium sp. NU13]